MNQNSSGATSPRPKSSKSGKKDGACYSTQRAVSKIANGRKATFAGSSTDSNLAMSLGIPAVTIGGGGEGGNWHSRNEWYKPTDAWMGPQNALLTVLMLSGLDGVSKPALAVRQSK